MFDETPEDTTNSVKVSARPELFHNRNRNIQKVDV